MRAPSALVKCLGVQWYSTCWDNSSKWRILLLALPETKREEQRIICYVNRSVVSNSLRPCRLYPLCMGFSRQEYWSGLPFPSPEDLPEPGIKPWSPALQVKSLNRVQLCATAWTVAYQAPPSTGFSRQEYWSGLPFPSPCLCKFWRQYYCYLDVLL